MNCPECGAENERTNRFCMTCGAVLPAQIQSKSRISQTSLDSEIRYSPSRTNNYRTARLIALLLKLFAWLSLGFSIFSVVGAYALYENSYSYPNGYVLGFDFYLSVFSILINLLMAPIFAFMSEGINVILDTEANSRQTAMTLERILRSQNSE